MGNYTAEQQAPDADLGRSIRPGWRNVSDDPERSFGLPMVRTDKPMPHVRGVADYQNYGDEPGARAVLNPPSYSELGVEPADFATPLPLPALVNIFARAGLAEAAAVEQAFREAGGGELGLSVIELRRALGV